MNFFLSLFAFIGVCLCGGLGAVARFVIDTAIKIVWKNAFPLSTLVINIIASFLAGAAASAPWHLMVVTGFLGGLSTFSTAINEIVSLGRDKRPSMAGYYLIACIVVPVLCAGLGWQLVR